ncbi:MAG: tetratricopeptide repeat protein [Nitrosospira multiformis]|nr:tetratricopeptide repeat protein [Nitrosospira multiformis]
MKVLPGIAILVISLISTDLHAASSAYCGELTSGHDYISGDKHLLGLVEQAHFTSNIENLRHGNSGSLGGELSYTLMMFPNHHRALAAFGKLSLREKTLKPVGAKYSVGCFFDRAIRFKPNDAIVRMVYGNYLLKAGKADEATEQLRIAVGLEPENPTINYNLGLLYLKQKDYEQAKTYAKKAYELEFPLPGLKNQLKQAGKWDE